MKTTMKATMTTTATQTVTASSMLLAILATALAAAGNPSPLPSAVKVAIIDDQSGVELETKHGIHALAVADMDGLLNATIRGSTPVRITLQVVDEDAADNKTASLDFRPYVGGNPPKAPVQGMPLDQLTKAMAVYRKDRAVWQQGFFAYRQTLQTEVEKFMKSVSENQIEVAERFDQMLAARNGADFNRSDIFGLITAANETLGKDGERFLVFNCDGVDLPAGRHPRKTPLVVSELDPSITIIFVNTSKQPESSAMFRGLPNPVRHADSVKAAMDMVAKELVVTGNESP